MLSDLNSFLRTAAVVLVVLLAAWWTWHIRGVLTEEQQELEVRDEQIAELSAQLGLERDRGAQLDHLLTEQRQRAAALEEDLEARVAEIAELNEVVARQGAALRLLKVDHRLARIEVLEQRAPEGDDEAWETDVRFTELALDGTLLGEPLELTIAGRFLYLESLVIKFDDDHVEAGDFLRGTSIALFRRAFGDQESPEQGVPLDRTGQLPGAYGGDAQPDPFYASLWERFWDYANDPEAAAEKGVRAIHGEAPFMELRPEGIYRVELRSSGGLSFRSE